MNKRHKKLLLVLIKLLVAAVLLGWVLSRAHWHDYVVDRHTGKSYAVVRTAPPGQTPRALDVSSGMLWWATVRKDRPASDFQEDSSGHVLVYPGFASSIAHLKPVFVILACLAQLVSMSVVGARWWGLVRILDIPLGLWEAMRLTVLGLFFNTVVPGTVGGDLVKAYYVGKHTPKKAAALVSVFVDRILGLTELTALAALMLLGMLVFGAAKLSDEGIRPAAITTVTVIAIVAGTVLFLLSSRFRRMLHLQKLYRRLPIAHQIDAAGQAVRTYSAHPGALLKAVFLTFLAHVAWIGGIILLGASLSLPIPWYSYFLYIPLIYIIGSVPVTPGGVGLIEKLYLVFFVAAGLGSSVLAMALLARLIPIFWSLPGLWVMVTGARPPKVEAMEAELGLAAEGAAQEPAP